MGADSSRRTTVGPGRQRGTPEPLADRVAIARARGRLFDEPFSAPRIGRFALIKQVGSGAMGTVYAAYDDVLDRRVAVKLLRARPESTESAERMLREAKAMARLSHPNVVPIYEAGRHEDSVYIAMEFIDGDLSSWLATKREPSAIVRVFVAAGRGLAAAHAVGIVHRDFKPDNVLVDDGGRPKVADFGLAGALPERLDEALEETAEGTPASLTRTGAILGTPAYLSPEQWSGAGASALSDQFAFCVALHEALHRVAPFEGDSTHALATNVIEGRRAEIQPSNEVPRWLQRVIDRGLATAPEDRWPSMDALADALADDPAGRRMRRVRGVAVLLAIGSAGLVYAGSTNEPAPCSGGASRLQAFWSDGDAEALRAAFEDSGKSYAEDTIVLTLDAIDEWTHAWLEQHREVCEATRRGEQSSATLDARMKALDRCAGELQAVVHTFVDADAPPVASAVSAVAGLPRPRQCISDEALSLLDQAHTDAERETVGEVWRLITDARAYQLTSQHHEALDRAKRAHDLAERSGLDMLRAEADLNLGFVLAGHARYEDAIEHLRAGTWSAFRQGSQASAAGGAIELARVIGYELRDPERAAFWVDAAEAFVDRTSASYGGLRSVLANVRGLVALRAEHYPLALEHFDEARQLLTDRGEDALMVASIQNNRALALRELGRNDEAREAIDDALAVRRRALGPAHPSIGSAMAVKAIALFDASEPEEAHATQLEGLAILEAALGPRHPRVSSARFNVAVGSTMLGRYEEAQEQYETLLEARRARFGDRHPRVAKVRSQLGLLQHRRGDHVGAREHLRAALAIYEEVGDRGQIADTHSNIGDTLRREGKLVEAAQAYDRSLELLQHSDLTESLSNAYPLRGRAWVYLLEGQSAAAIPLLEQAKAHLAEGSDPERGEVEYLLGWARWEQGDRGAGLAGVRGAKELLADAGRDWALVTREIDQWIAAHSGGSDSAD